MIYGKPILVTGSHRSGTTWTGRILTASPEAAYIHEPFNIGMRVTPNSRVFAHWFQYLCEENGAEYERALHDILEFGFPFWRNLKAIRNQYDALQLIQGQFSRFFYRNRKRPVLKDPLAFFSAEWLEAKFGMNVLVLIRHPAAFTSSLKRKNWTFDFRNFSSQKGLMDEFLFPFKGEIEALSRAGGDIIDQSILLWNCIHHTISEYRKRHPDWVFVRHEDLSLEPIGEFKEIFEKFELTFSSRVEDKIRKSTDARNPAEQKGLNQFKRDSKANIKNWQKRLTEEEIERVRRGTSAIAADFYGEESW